MILAAEGLTLPWPIALLLTLFSLIVALGSAIAFFRASSVRANLDLLRGERDDYEKAYKHADEERDKCQTLLDARVKHYEEEISELQGKVNTLTTVVGGTHAIKELGDLMVTMSAQHHVQQLDAIQAVGNEVKSKVDSLLTLMGQGGRAGGKRRSDSPEV